MFWNFTFFDWMSGSVLTAVFWFERWHKGFGSFSPSCFWLLKNSLVCKGSFPLPTLLHLKVKISLYSTDTSRHDICKRSEAENVFRPFLFCMVFADISLLSLLLYVLTGTDKRTETQVFTIGKRTFMDRLIYTYTYIQKQISTYIYKHKYLYISR